MNPTRALRHAAAACAFLSFGSAALAANTDPVILVHGFAGFGRNELLGYKYWGGFTDLQVQLQAKYSNQLVATAVMGPFSSNWDRAVELFYQIKGGCVDYGALHSAANSHLERPKAISHNGRTCYPGLYPAWDASHPVHLVSHSMGGQTARMLVQMLAANGAPANPSAVPVCGQRELGQERHDDRDPQRRHDTGLPHRRLGAVRAAVGHGHRGRVGCDRWQRDLRLQARPVGRRAAGRGRELQCLRQSRHEHPAVELGREGPVAVRPVARRRDGRETTGSRTSPTSRTSRG